MAVVVPFIGAAIGGAIGGTFLGVGAASWGWIVGSLLASAIFKPPNQQGPRLDDLTIVGTDYGQAFPWVAGSPRLAPQYIWASAIREIPNTQKVGKGGSQKHTTYTYEVDVLVRLTENVTEGVARDWVNSELVRNGLTLKDGVWSGITVYTGEDDQLPDPVYEAAVGSGNAPAYRGGTTILIQGLQLGGGKQLPNLEHQMSPPRFGRSDLLFYAPFDADFNDHSGNGLVATVSQNLPTYGYTIGAGKFDGSLAAVGNHLNSNTANVRYSSASFSISGSYTIGFWAKLNSYPSGSGDFVVWFRRSDANLNNSMSIQGSTTGFRFNASFSTLDIPVSLDTWNYITVSRTGSSNNVVRCNGVLIGVVTASLIVDTNLLVLMGNTTANQHVDCEIDDLFILAGEDLYPADFTPPTSPIGYVQRNPYLNEVLTGLLDRCGYRSGEYEISGLSDLTVHGYATGNVTSTRAHLETLRPFGLYEANCSDKLYIFPRATTPAGAIPWDDLGASETPGEPSDPFPLNIGNEVEVPAQIAVRYRNVLADWNTGTEFSDRINSSLVSTQTVDMPFGMTPEQAKKVADTILKDAMAGLGRATLRLGGRKHAKYEPGDILTTTAPDGTGYRFRIITKRDHIFMLEWEVALDDASALESEAITDEGYVSTEPLRVAPTEWEVMAIPALQDSDATVPGPYVAITPAKNADNDEWPGAVFVRARLPEAFDQVFISGDVCVMGACQTTLGDFAEGSTVLDWTQILRVRVRGELSSSNWDDFFADRTINAALVGDEPIRFMNADFVSTDGQFRIYDLSGLMRGQLGQEVQIDGHVASERFVLLNPSLRRMVNQTTDIGQEHQVKAVTLNLLLDSVTAEDFTDDGIALRPYSPVHLVALADTSGDIDLTWVRRSRLVARYTDQGVFAPLGEATEAYRVKVYDGVTLVRTQDVTTQAWTYAAADIASDGFSSTDPITITVQQLSETVGEGFAATVETTAP